MAKQAEGMAGLVLPFTPLCLTFCDISYYVPMPKVGTSNISDRPQSHLLTLPAQAF